MKTARVDLDRALDALVENAIQVLAARQRGAARVTGTGERARCWTPGPGLAPGEEEDVFDRFHRGRAGRMEPGGHRPRAADRARADAPLGCASPGRESPRGWRSRGHRLQPREIGRRAVKLRMSRPTLLWVALALVGLVVAMSVSYAASQLSKPTVGLNFLADSRVTELAPKPARGGTPRAPEAAPRRLTRGQRPATHDHNRSTEQPTPDCPGSGRQRRERRRRLMRRVIVRAAVVVVVLLVVIQAVPYGRNHTNPPLRAEPKWDSARTRQLAVDACFACHSNQTRWPWYSSVAPVSWLTQHDVEDGRRILNFSEWDRPNAWARRPKRCAREACRPCSSRSCIRRRDCRTPRSRSSFEDWRRHSADSACVRPTQKVQPTARTKKAANAGLLASG